MLGISHLTVMLAFGVAFGGGGGGGCDWCKKELHKVRQELAATQAALAECYDDRDSCRADRDECFGDRDSCRFDRDECFGDRDDCRCDREEQCRGKPFETLF